MNPLFLIALTILLLVPTLAYASSNVDNKTFDKCYKKINGNAIVPIASINESKTALQLFKTNHTVPTNGLVLEEITLMNICMTGGMGVIK